MTVALAFGIALIVTATSFVSGIFGMAGGLVLIGALLALLPVSVAMVLPGGASFGANTFAGQPWAPMFSGARWPWPPGRSRCTSRAGRWRSFCSGSRPSSSA